MVVHQPLLDEESDIRQSTDKNSCGTSVQATQVAEGMLRTKTVYNIGH